MFILKSIRLLELFYITIYIYSTLYYNLGFFLVYWLKNNNLFNKNKKLKKKNCEIIKSELGLITLKSIFKYMGFYRFNIDSTRYLCTYIDSTGYQFRSIYFLYWFHLIFAFMLIPASIYQAITDVLYYKVLLFF